MWFSCQNLLTVTLAVYNILIFERTIIVSFLSRSQRLFVNG